MKTSESRPAPCGGRRRLLLLTVLGSLLLTAFAPAAQASWQEQFEGIEAALESASWKPAQRLIHRLEEDLLKAARAQEPPGDAATGDRERDGNKLADAAARLAVLQAVLHAGLREPRLASWFWHSAYGLSRNRGVFVLDRFRDPAARSLSAEPRRELIEAVRLVPGIADLAAQNSAASPMSPPLLVSREREVDRKSKRRIQRLAQLAAMFELEFEVLFYAQPGSGGLISKPYVAFARGGPMAIYFTMVLAASGVSSMVATEAGDGHYLTVGFRFVTKRGDGPPPGRPRLEPVQW